MALDDAPKFIKQYERAFLEMEVLLEREMATIITKSGETIGAITDGAKKSVDLSKLLEKLADGDKAIVSVWTKKLKGHAMVLEKVENGKVFLRDPMPKDVGKSYSMKIEDFKSIFNKKAVIIKK